MAISAERGDSSSKRKPNRLRSCGCTSCSAFGYRPCWALGSAGAIRNFPVVDGIESLTIMVDNDPADQRGRRAGDEAATECWHRWNDAGREVQAYTTGRPGTDIADVIKGAHHE
jgi:putative DNA primase/helicase